MLILPSNLYRSMAILLSMLTISKWWIVPSEIESTTDDKLE